MKIENAKVFKGDCFCAEDIFIDGDRFVIKSSDSEPSIDATGLYAIPGLIDIHSHGAVSNDYSDSDVFGINKMLEYEAKNGITSICATTMTLSFDHLKNACENIKNAGTKNGSKIVGINLEGPFVSLSKIGAQNPKYVMKPDAEFFRKLNEISGGLVKLLAVAPEENGAMELIDEVANEVNISIAHSSADYDTAMEAFKKGANHITHIHNAMPPIIHREPSIIGAGADCDSVYAEMICDCVHIHPSTIRQTIKMYSSDRICFISDSMMATGLSDGKYSLGGLDVNVSGNLATLVDGGAIAGSVTNLYKCMVSAVKNCEIPLEIAVKCSTINPAKSIGIFDEIGSIDVGKKADLVLLNEDLEIVSVYKDGQKIN